MREPAALGEVRVVPVSSLIPSPDNPRKISDKAVDVVAKSISRFGWQQPLVVDKDLVVVVGHTRRLAAIKLGLKNVPVVTADNLTPREIQAYRINDNRTNDFTSWDFASLTTQLEELSGDFAEEFALADWKSIVGEFNAMEAADLVAGGNLELPGDVASYVEGKYQITVVFDSEETLQRVSARLIQTEGVLDVRNKR